MGQEPGSVELERGLGGTRAMEPWEPMGDADLEPINLTRPVKALISKAWLENKMLPT